VLGPGGVPVYSPPTIASLAIQSAAAAQVTGPVLPPACASTFASISNITATVYIAEPGPSVDELSTRALENSLLPSLSAPSLSPSPVPPSHTSSHPSSLHPSHTSLHSPHAAHSSLPPHTSHSLNIHSSLTTDTLGHSRGGGESYWGANQVGGDNYFVTNPEEIPKHGNADGLAEIKTETLSDVKVEGSEVAFGGEYKNEGESGEKDRERENEREREVEKEREREREREKERDRETDQDMNGEAVHVAETEPSENGDRPMEE
jgi:hypothetical protein